MLALDHARTALAEIADCLEYPTTASPPPVLDTANCIREEYSDAAKELVLFWEETEDYDFDALQQAYTSAFDLTPQCVPYLSVYLFGEDSPKRAELMTGLQEVYARSGRERGNELADHIAVVLRHSSYFTEEEWLEFVRLCMPGPVREMVRGLDRSNNPYRHVIAAIVIILEQQYPQEFGSC